MITRIAATLAVLASTAHADPDAVVTTGATPQPTPSIYVGASSLAGVTPGRNIVLGGSLDSGQRMTGPVWAHEEIATGIGGEIFGPNNTFVAGRIGLEARGCIPEGWACVAGGLDAGVAHYTWDRMTTKPTDEEMIIPRVAVDLGNKRFRLRPALEVPLGNGGYGIEAKLGAMFQW